MSTLIAPNFDYSVLDTVQAGSADFSLSGGQISIGNPLVKLCNYRDLYVGRCSVTASVAEVLQVTTLTPTAANNSTYEIIIQQYNPTDGTYYYFQRAYTTAASGDTATSIGDFFRTAINTQAAFGTLQIAATGTTTLILTALAGYAKFTVSILQTGGGLTQATGTAGVVAIGTRAALALQGITVTNTAYTTVLLNYAPITGQDNKSNMTLRSEYMWLLNEGDGDTAALVATIRYTLDGRSVSAGGPASNEAISVI